MTRTVTVTWRPDADRFDATGSHPVTIPINAPHGDPGDTGVSGFSAAELLLAGAGSCSTWDVVEILRKQRQDITGLAVEVVGEQAQDPPWAYQHVLLRFTVRGRNISEERARRAVELSVEKYCSAVNSLRGVARIETEVVVEDEPPGPGDEPPVPGDEPPVPGDEPPVPGDEPPVPGEGPPLRGYVPG